MPTTDKPASPGGERLGRFRSIGPWTNSVRPTDIPAVAWLVPCALAAVYFVLFALRFTGNIAASDWVADYSGGFVLAETVAHTGTGGNTVISTTGAWVPLWFGLITANLPLHRQLWEVMPTVLFIASALTIGWSVDRVSGRREAILSVLIMLVASPWALRVFIAAVAHNVVYPCTALLGAYLVWLAKGQRQGRIKTVAVPLLGAIVLGVCVASDALLIVTGVIPFALTAITAGLRRGRSSRIVALSALTTAIGAIPIAFLTGALMRSAGYVTVPPAAKVGSGSIISENAKLLFTGLKELSNGYLGAGWPGTLHAVIGTACSIVLIAALFTLLFVGLRGATRFILSGRRLQGGETQSELALGLHTVYWLSSALAVCGAFVVSSAAEKTSHVSYYITVLFSIAAIVPLVISRGVIQRTLVLGAVSIFFVGSIVGLKRNYLQVTEPPLAHYAAQIVKLARANNARTGYAGYWDASSLTWNSHSQVVVRPLVQCSNSPRAPICPFVLMRTPSWYVPRPRRSFLLVDPNNLYVTTLPSGLGTPIASYAIGSIQMYVYPYDIASQLGPGSN